MHCPVVVVSFGFASMHPMLSSLLISWQQHRITSTFNDEIRLLRTKTHQEHFMHSNVAYDGRSGGDVTICMATKDPGELRQSSE
jgi:hypothetical protein